VQPFLRVFLLATAAIAAASSASAQVVHSVQIGFGGVFPRGLDARSADDILLRNYVGAPMEADPSVSDALAFEIGDFKAAQIFGEWNVALNRHVEFGAGLGFYRRTVPTVYLDVVDENSFDIAQSLRLRVVPITALVRFLPFGGPGDVQPYLGAGVTALNFRYSEFGDFVDPRTLDIFTDRVSKSGTAVGGVLLGGVRIPLGGDIYGLGLEGRYHWGEGSLQDADSDDKLFVADKIDLGGGQFNVTFLLRF
jgi:hypothetical protein